MWFTTILSQIVDERLNDLQSSHSQPHPHVGSNQRHCSGEIISCQRCSLYWHSVFKRTVVRNVENINHTYQQSWERRRACSRGAPRCRGGRCWCWWGCRVGGTCSAELSDWSWYISSELRSLVNLEKKQKETLITSTYVHRTTHWCFVETVCHPNRIIIFTTELVQLLPHILGIAVREGVVRCVVNTVESVNSLAEILYHWVSL